PWISQFAVLRVCQMPLKSGLPSGARVPLDAGERLAAITGPRAATVAKTIEPLRRLLMRTPGSALYDRLSSFREAIPFLTAMSRRRADGPSSLLPVAWRDLGCERDQ